MNTLFFLYEIMPIKLNSKIPAYDELKKEWVFVMSDDRAEHQRIRPIRIGILNIMPRKIETETQILRMIWSGPLQIDPVFIKTASYNPKNTNKSHLDFFYKDFLDVMKTWLDGFIITGAPVEKLDFEDVIYWKELTEIMDILKEKVSSTLFLCWGAQAWLYNYYWIQKHLVSEKIFGIFNHKNENYNHPLFRGIDDEFWCPHARHTEVLEEDINEVDDLDILVRSGEAWIHIVANRDASMVFVMGHPEYDRNTLYNEYLRDQSKWESIDLPKNYFENDDTSKPPKLLWRSNAETFFRNWVNEVYQKTPYELETL